MTDAPRRFYIRWGKTGIAISATPASAGAVANCEGLYILATPDAIAASPEGSTLLAEALLAQRAQIDADHAALILEAEARGMERAAKICAGLSDQVSNAVLTGLPEQARLRESMEAAFTKARHAIRAEAAAIRETKP